MTVLQESPWYNEILNQGEKKGLISGIERGLEVKFGSEGLELMSEISQIKNVDLLRLIQQELWTINSLEEIRQIYQTDEL
ncbi:MAG: hypothetical protein AAF063_27265 [Cyanobacteria bacterium J06643_5]